jgi:hypothetical protein
MLRQKFSGILLGLLLLGPGMAGAATVLTTGPDNDIAIGILDLDVGGTLYNVDFLADTTADDLYGSPPRSYDFDNETAASAALDAVIAALNAHTPEEITDVGADGNVRFYIGYEDTFLDTLLFTVESQYLNSDWQNNGRFEMTNTFRRVYADFSPIPVPAAVWLFGSGLLGLIGVARRRKTV